MENGIGLVLAGGGCLGAYQVGVFRALEETGIKKSISEISGSSVGALNTALFIYLPQEEIEKVWLNVRQDDFTYIESSELSLFKKLTVKTLSVLGLLPFIVRISPSLAAELGIVLAEQIVDYINGTGGIFSQQRIADLMKTNISFEDKRYLSYKVFSTISKNKKGKYVDWSTVDPSQIYKLLLASSAIPIFYPSVKFQGKRYEDGGLADNVPIRPLYDAGYRKFIAVYLQNKKNAGINSQIEFEKKNFPDADILRIFPREEMKDDILHGFIINGKVTEQRIKWGYEDAINVFICSSNDILSTDKSDYYHLHLPKRTLK